MKKIIAACLVMVFMFGSCKESPTSNELIKKEFLIEFDELKVDGSKAFYTINIPEITNKVIANGSISLRVKYDDIWHDLPLKEEYYYCSTCELNHTVTTDYSYEEGSLTIIHITTNDEFNVIDIQLGPYELLIDPN